MIIPHNAVKSMVELIPFLLKVKGVKYVLTEKFCQDPLESFFGKQRIKGGSNDNPNVATFLKNTSSLRFGCTEANERKLSSWKGKHAEC